MDVLDSSGRIVGDSASAPQTPRLAGRFLDWFRSLVTKLGERQSAAAPPSSAARPGSRASAAEFVIAPGGYRIRVPSKDAERSADQAIPVIQDALASVPPLPNVVLEMIKEVQNPSATAASVADLAGTDPALVAALLRAVNSASCALTRKVTSVAEAVSYLGFATVRSIVVRSRLDQSLPRAAATAWQSAADTRDLWIHCLAVSYIADALAQRVPGVDRSFASTLGLLHDIGKLAIVAKLGSYALPTETSNELLHNREVKEWGVDHAALGALLALRWSLPADLVKAIRWHQHPERAFEPTDPPALRKAAYVVQIANELAKYVYPYADEMELDPTAQFACTVLGLNTPIANLMDVPIRAAVTRAILFGFEDASGTLPRRFIRLRSPSEAAALAESAGAGSHQLGRIRVDQDLVAAALQTQNPAEHFTAPATAAGVAALIAAIEKHQELLSVAPSARPTSLFALRALLSNLTEGGSKSATIEVVQRLKFGKLMIAIHSEMLAISNRLGDAAGFGPQLLEIEFTNLLNLNWFDSITITPDGRSILLTGR
jgi:putative nucleotidyltransferase with HDIG domain